MRVALRVRLHPMKSFEALDIHPSVCPIDEIMMLSVVQPTYIEGDSYGKMLAIMVISRIKLHSKCDFVNPFEAVVR